MKKLYKKGKVHPSPPLISDHLAFLPATILTLTAALSPEDREVLAYLISCSGSQTSFQPSKKTTHNHKSLHGGSVGGGADHPPLFHCNCFRCYTSYWVRWDASPNHQLIHDIIDAFEDELTQKKMKNKKDRKKKRGSNRSNDMKSGEEDSRNIADSGETGSAVVSCVGDGGNSSGDDGGSEEGGEFEKGLVRKFVSFIGETIWGVWN